MLKVTKHNLTLIIPDHWIDGRGFLKVPAVYALKLFFGEMTLEEAQKGAKRKWRYGWIMKEVKDKNESRGDRS